MSRELSIQTVPARAATLGNGMEISRALPSRQRRSVGAWVFLDHFGPADIAGQAGVDVAPHPHTGLQTVSWLLEGEMLHKDSLGYEQLIRPGQLNLMTAGRGISHSEESPPDHGDRIHGVQFWVALPDEHRNMEPTFDHHPEVPVLHRDDARVSLLIGEHDGERSPANTHSPLVGLEVHLPAAGRVDLPVDPAHEHAVMLIEGEICVCGRTLTTGALHYLGFDRARVDVTSPGPARFMFVGGEPLRIRDDEKLLLWWNFVGRRWDEIRGFSEAWGRGDERFGEVAAYRGDRLEAPPLP